MESSTEPDIAFCASCEKREFELNEPLKRCARCRSINYCSTSCQREHWPQHKTRCESAAVNSKTGGRQRALTRLRIFATLSDTEDENIFWLKKSIPHLDDITMAGPFYPRKAIVEQIQGYMHKVSDAGMASICDLAEDLSQLHKLEHIKAPLNKDPSKFIIVQVIEKHDAAMARRLPGPVFNVLRTTILMPHEAAERNAQSGPSPYPRVKEVEIMGCFATMEEANTKATTQTGQVEQELQNAQELGGHVARSGSPFMATIMGQERDGKPSCVMIEVRFDSGNIVRRV